MPYNRHTNPELIEAFHKEPVPYQDADPATASCVFIGLDANFDEHIENSIIFDEIRAYLHDGPQFWRDKGVHHPFLLNGHNGDGQYYHAEFAQIGFTSQHADCLSFVEIVPVPTYGISDLRTADIHAEEINNHLRELSKIIIRGSQHVFISKNVGRLLRASEYFDWLPHMPTPDPSGNLTHLKIWDNEVRKCVYCHTHFSRWDRLGMEAKIRERPEIKKLCEN